MTCAEMHVIWEGWAGVMVRGCSPWVLQKALGCCKRPWGVLKGLGRVVVKESRNRRGRWRVK
jgi:hypothetical protein